MKIATYVCFCAFVCGAAGLGLIGWKVGDGPAREYVVPIECCLVVGLIGMVYGAECARRARKSEPSPSWMVRWIGNVLAACVIGFAGVLIALTAWFLCKVIAA